ncbi:MAG TPA: oligosaccharide flippase family protein [Verrucomicrobiae bacterium]|nr:oligosaccharide flippase family protein [Verrucomicrobiae bacterium]
MPVLSPTQLKQELFSLADAGRLQRGRFFRNVLLVMSGTGAAQLLGLLLAPLLSRLYAPVDFGLYGSFLSVIGILSSGLTLQYYEALMLPKRDEQAAALFLAGCFSALVLSLTIGSVIFFLPAAFWSVLKTPGLGRWIWLAPLAALTICFNQMLIAWCSRRKAFHRTATMQVVRSLTANSSQAAAGFARWGGVGLLGGNMSGEFIGGLLLWVWVLRRDARLLKNCFQFQHLLAAARSYRDFPLFSTPQNVLNAVAQGAPVLLLIHFYGAAIAGLYAFAVRVLQVPMNFVLTSLRQVLFQKFSELEHSGVALEPWFARCTLGLLLAALGPTLLGILLAPWAFALVFGQPWHTAGECARWLLLWFLPAFCNVPSVLLARILRRQKNLLLYDLCLTSTRIAVLIGCGSRFSALTTIAVFSIVGALFNSLLIVWAWRLTRTHDRTHTPASPPLGDPRESMPSPQP